MYVSQSSPVALTCPVYCNHGHMCHIHHLHITTSQHCIQLTSWSHWPPPPQRHPHQHQAPKPSHLHAFARPVFVVRFHHATSSHRYTPHQLFALCTGLISPCTSCVCHARTSKDDPLIAAVARRATPHTTPQRPAYSRQPSLTPPARQPLLPPAHACIAPHLALAN
jgi:hypothetical protein